MFSSKFSTGILKHPGYNVGGGIGEAALVGAAFGGAKALATGEDPLENAILGGITGGAMSGITSSILTPGTEALPALTGEVAPAYEALPANTFGNLIETPQAAVMTQNAQNLGLTGPQMEIGANLGQVTPVGGYVPGGAYTSGISPDTFTNQVAPIIDKGTQTAGGGIRDALGIKPDTMLGKGLDWWNKQDTLSKAGYAGAAGYGLGALTQKPFEAPVPEKYKSKLASMSEDYEPLNNPIPVYPRFAEGGIAAMADGGINMPTMANVDFMGGDMYPQSQQQRSFYATPTQMPTSAQQAMASYEPKTNPLTGQPTAHMASGGIAGYSLGGYADGGNPRLLKGPGDGMSDNIPATIGSKQPARLADGEFVVPADVVSHLGNGSTDAGAKHLYAMMDNVRKARTGSKKQGKQIKADKYLPA